MPDHWKAFVEGDLGSVAAALVAAFLRGLVGPGPWRWREFLLASATAIVLALFVAPGLAEYLELGRRMTATIAALLGLVGLPLVRGIIGLVRAFGQDPTILLRRNGGRDRDRRD